MKKQTRGVIIGATSLMAEHCARIWNERSPICLMLVGRDLTKLERLANDLRIRNHLSEIDIIESGFIDATSIRNTVDWIAGRGQIDFVLIAQGALPDQRTCQENLQLCQSTLEINALSPVLFAEAFAHHMGRANHGTICLIGSVAGDRGRQSNYVYGAAKGLVERYAQGLQHRFYRSGVSVVLIKPGPTDTPMTAALKDSGLMLAPVEQVSRIIAEAIDQKTPVAYAPKKWKLIMLVIFYIPNSIFNKIRI
jgi:short-subunit dehydrogenase